MVLSSCIKLLFRRLALRKGVALSAVCLTLLGACLLYYQYSKNDQFSSNSRNVGVRKVPVPTLPPSLIPQNTSNRPLPIDQSVRTNQPIKLQHQPKVNDEISVISDHLPECLFSAHQPTQDHVDVQISEVVDQLKFDDQRSTGGWNQGFDITYSMDDFKEQPLQVFVVPHSHNDPGWIKTFEEYYRKQTRNILNLMTDALTADNRKKFIWAEISYLDLWWQEQGEERRQKFRRLVENKQLEIVTGGWVMNDEANTHYYSMLDQIIEGHLWLQKNLPGTKPSAGWAIDPFGYTSTMAYLLQGAGLDSMLIQRVHYAVKKHLAYNKQLEFGWLQEWDHGYDTGILCHMMPFYSYDVPHTCGPNPKICCQFDFLRLPGGRVKCPWKVTPQAITDGNIKERSEMLADQYRKKSRLYRSNILLVPLGDDFRWDAQKEIDNQFSNYYKLMDYMNSHSDMNIHIKFATLGDYFEALRDTGAPNRVNNLVPDGFPMLAGDFFTYADRADHYWSGYYTSRPYHKNMERVLLANLRVAEVFYSLVIARGIPLNGKLEGVARILTEARRNLGLFQHHDGITGTAKDHVVVDYAKRVLNSITSAKGVLSASVHALTTASTPLHMTDQVRHMTFDPHETFILNKVPQHEKITLSDGSKVVTFVNPLPQVAMQLVTVTVDSPSVIVTDSNNGSQPCQLSPVFGPDYISALQFNLSFIVTVPALGLAHYKLTIGEGECVKANVQFINMEPLKSNHFHTESVRSQEDFVLATSHGLEAKFSSSTGLLKLLTLGSSEVLIDMDFVTYGTTTGRDKSGAYLFFPGGDAKSVISAWGKPPVAVVVGPLYQEVRTTIDSGLVVHSVQLFNSPGVDGKSVAISNLVDITRESNKEVAMRIHTSVENADETFYTDENAFQLIKRRTYSKIPLQGNFYPMPTCALIQDANHRVTLFSGQPLGVASLKKGWLEVVMDRRLMQDDNRGVGQGVKDSVLTLEPFRLLVERRLGDASPTAPLVYHSLLAHATLDNLLHPIQCLVSSSPLSPHILTPYTPLTSPFPCDMHLVNFRALVDSGPENAESALIIHRRGFDCGFDVGPLQCELVDGEIKLSELFSGSGLLSSATHTSLSLLHEKSVLEQETGFLTQIKPMHIHTYKLTW